MTLVTARELVAAAATAGTGVGAFNVIHLETAEALVRASAQAQLPVILQISQTAPTTTAASNPSRWQRSRSLVGRKRRWRCTSTTPSARNS
ncbi:hypothetical protein GCM10009860_24570 [Microbacterium mitrae]